MTLPNLVVIGAAKSGTTALYQFLRQHPDIYMSPLKEPHFFAFEGETLSFRGPGVTLNTAITTLEDYLKLFKGVAGERIVGEASATYLPVPRAAARLREYVPDARLIAILRDPVDRAYSSFLHLMREGREPCRNFEEALRLEPERAAENWGYLWRYVELGFYHRQLARFHELFSPGQIRVFLYEDLRHDPAALMGAIFRFLEVDEGFVPDTSGTPNVSGFHRNPIAQRAVETRGLPRILARRLLPRRLRADLRARLHRNLVKPELDADLRRRLQRIFREDTLALQQLIQRDLSAWLE